MGLIDYHTPEAHVAMRDGLPCAIRPTLLEEAESDWRKHPRFAGKASFFMNIHRQLLDGSDWLAHTSENLMDLDRFTRETQSKALNLHSKTNKLLGFAHGHHEIEDHGYFPQFARKYPNLDRALALLDGDHKVLDEALQGVEAALGGDLADKDGMAALHRHAAALQKIMHRHITDEEEVIIPIFPRHG